MNKIKMGIYEIDETLYNSPMIVKKWFQNNQCLLGYKGSKTLWIDNMQFFNTNGFHIKLDDTIEISFSKGNRVKIYPRHADKITIERSGNDIKITLL